MIWKNQNAVVLSWLVRRRILRRVVEKAFKESEVNKGTMQARLRNMGPHIINFTKNWGLISLVLRKEDVSE